MLRGIRVLGACLAALGLACLAGQASACEGGPDAWSRGYLQLRASPGHFSGAAWSPAVDAWGGEKHRLMQCLAEHAAAVPLRRVPLRRLMGPPDERVPCPSAACSEVAASAEWLHGAAPATAPTEWWLYHWRGRHDRLAFAMADGTVRAAGWLYVRE